MADATDDALVIGNHLNEFQVRCKLNDWMLKHFPSDLTDVLCGVSELVAGGRWRDIESLTDYIESCKEWCYLYWTRNRRFYSHVRFQYIDLNENASAYAVAILDREAGHHSSDTSSINHTLTSDSKDHVQLPADPDGSLPMRLALSKTSSFSIQQTSEAGSELSTRSSIGQLKLSRIHNSKSINSRNRKSNVVSDPTFAMIIDGMVGLTLATNSEEMLDNLRFRRKNGFQEEPLMDPDLERSKESGTVLSRESGCLDNYSETKNEVGSVPSYGNVGEWNDYTYAMDDHSSAGQCNSNEKQEDDLNDSELTTANTCESAVEPNFQVMRYTKFTDDITETDYGEINSDTRRSAFVIGCTLCKGIPEYWPRCRISQNALLALRLTHTKSVASFWIEKPDGFPLGELYRSQIPLNLILLTDLTKNDNTAGFFRWVKTGGPRDPGWTATALSRAIDGLCCDGFLTVSPTKPAYFSVTLSGNGLNRISRARKVRFADRELSRQSQCWKECLSNYFYWKVPQLREPSTQHP